MRVALIANPVAGVGRARSYASQLSEVLRRNGCDVNTYFTSGPGDAAGLVRTIYPPVDCLVVAGGDGTIHEVINGMHDPSAIPIAILGVGSLNVLAKELGLPKTIAGVADLVLTRKKRYIDLGHVGQNRRFLMLASAGLDAAIIKAIHKQRRGTLGIWGFPLPILKTMLTYDIPTVRVHVDENEPAEGAMVVVANTVTYAGFLRPADRAQCDSGHLDVIVLRNGTIPSLIRYIWASWRQTLSRQSDVTYHCGRSIRLDSDDRVDIELDGEYYGTTPVEITVTPRVVPFLVPNRDS